MVKDMNRHFTEETYNRQTHKEMFFHCNQKNTAQNQDKVDLFFLLLTVVWQKFKSITMPNVGKHVDIRDSGLYIASVCKNQYNYFELSIIY